jgi:ABC-type transport system involved in Fe-S cluster assembly fused permease/ATPase subunit
LRLDSLRSHVALVSQDMYLLNDTLQANIRSRGLTPARKHCNSRLNDTGPRVQFAETGADGFQ